MVESIGKERVLLHTPVNHSFETIADFIGCEQDINTCMYMINGL